MVAFATTIHCISHTAPGSNTSSKPASMGTYISADLTWNHNTIMLVKKAQERLHFQVLRKNKLDQKLLLLPHLQTQKQLLPLGRSDSSDCGDGCSSGSRAGHLLIRKLVVQSLAFTVRMLNFLGQLASIRESICVNA